ncbi:glycosyltransferase family 4 protein [uncultured Enorma sp.]|uniref:glycosyltransferase family 4 protein n=1 Tax=uncultured Enorma sp. TaxID=1714346 RepID=UPI002596BD73|nr:glycosyltransferase [uncultured Enorma sp.]
MKVLWISASFSAMAKEVLFGQKNTHGSGNWIDDEAAALLEGNELEELVIISSRSKQRRIATDHKITYIDLGLGSNVAASRFRLEKLHDAIRVTLKNVSPDIVQVWGTESPVSCVAMQCAREAGISSILCPQGLVASLLHFPNGCVSAREMCGMSALDWLKMPFFNATKRTYRKHALYEAKSIELAEYVLSDNQWTFDYCSCFNPSIRTLWYPLPVNESFTKKRWSFDGCTPHTILSVSPRSSYKGQHVLIRALARVKARYSDVKVCFPAMAEKMRGRVANSLKRTPYNSMLLRLIEQHGLQENVVFLDRLSPNDLAKVMCECNVFVNPSVIESNCMSLREAMWMGMPVISAFTGSIQEYLDNEENGILYRYEEDEILARELERLFESPRKCERLGEHARASMIAFYKDDRQLIDLYREVLCARG